MYVLLIIAGWVILPLPLAMLVGRALSGNPYQAAHGTLHQVPDPEADMVTGQVKVWDVEPHVEPDDIWLPPEWRTGPEWRAG